MRGTEGQLFRINETSPFTAQAQRLGIARAVVRGQNQSAGVLQHARHGGELRQRRLGTLRLADKGRQLARLLATIPDLIDRQNLQHLGIDLRKDVGRQHQYLGRFRPQQLQRLHRVGRPSAQSEKCRIDHLHDLGGHAHVAAYDLAHFLQRIILGLQFAIDFHIQRRQTGHRAHFGNHRQDRRIAQQLPQCARTSPDLTFQRHGIARLGQMAMRHREQAQDGVAATLTREHHARDLGIALAHLFQQLRAVHLRHAHVRHDDVERFLCQAAQGFAATGGEFRPPFVSKRPKHAA